MNAAKFAFASIGLAAISANVRAAEPNNSSQKQVTRLACSGDYRFYGEITPVTDDGHSIDGVYIEVTPTQVKVIGVPRFANYPGGSTYRVTMRNEHSIHFKNGANLKQYGVLNRLSGSVDFSELADPGNPSSRFISWFQGNCVPYHPKF